MYKTIMLFSLTFISLYCTQTAQQKYDTLNITFISNSGFLLNSSNQKFLIDGIYSQGYGIFTVPSDDIVNKERNAITPFNSSDLLLVSHYHADHINQDYVIDHLMKDSAVVLLSTPQVKSLLENNQNYILVEKNIKSLAPPSGIKIDTTINDVHLKIFSLRHNNDSKNEHQNLGFIINSDQFRMFHPGDGQADNPEEYKNLNLADDSIDIAFIPYWFFDSDKKGKEIIDYLKPKAIVIIHIRINQSSIYRAKVNGMSGIPPVYFMDNPMQSISFTKNNGELSVLTSVENNNSTQSTFDLSQNYPNPFNPATKIKYSIPTTPLTSILKKERKEVGFVTIKVYNILGNEIATLVDEEKPAGNYEVEFNGSNLASGIYFYRICCSKFTTSRKMILLK